MKICIINNLFEPFNRGGAEKIIKITAEELALNKNEIFIISTKPSDKKSPDNPMFRSYFLNSQYFNLNKFPSYQKFIWHLANTFNLIKYFQIKKILKNEKPDLVITHNLIGLGLLTPLAINRLKIPNIQYLHDIQLLHPSGLIMFGQEKIIDSISAKIYQFFCRFLFSFPSLVLSPSDWLMALYRKKKFFLDSQCKIIPNPISAPAINCSNQKKTSSADFSFLYVGQIERHKGIDTLLTAFQKLKNENIKLLIVGHGSWNPPKNLINSKVIFVGWKNQQEIMAIMSKADALIVPSRCYENSPTVIYEAAICGLPVIASNIGGIPELINQLGGKTFTPESAKELADIMDETTKNPEWLKTSGILSQQKIREFETKKYFEKLNNLLNLSSKS
jgi:glycosyltransferase involved in cell wall biosynthesis